MDGIFNNELPIWMNIINWVVMIFCVLIMYATFIEFGEVGNEVYSRGWSKEDNLKELERNPLGVWFLSFWLAVALSFFLASLPNLFFYRGELNFDRYRFSVYFQRTMGIYVMSLIMFYVEYAKWKIKYR